MNTLEKWCKHLNIAIDEKQKIVFWEKHDELKLGIINAELQEAFTFKEIPLIEIEKDDYRDRQGLTDRIISEINKLARKYFNITDYLKWKT